jgi:hypothetical protein
MGSTPGAPEADSCSIADEFFVRGMIGLPIIGHAECFGIAMVHPLETVADDMLDPRID